jgi:hypothetical protein
MATIGRLMKKLDMVVSSVFDTRVDHAPDFLGDAFGIYVHPSRDLLNPVDYHAVARIQTIQDHP